MEIGNRSSRMDREWQRTEIEWEEMEDGPVTASHEVLRHHADPKTHQIFRWVQTV